MKTLNKKGSMFDIIIWIAVAVIVLIFFASLQYGISFFNTELTSIKDSITDSGGVGEYSNFSDIAKSTSGQLNLALVNNLHLIAFAIIFGMIFTIFVTNFFQKSHPIFFIVYWFICVPATLMSVYVSNTYESLMGDTTIGSTLQTYTAGSFVMLHLPAFAIIITLVGGLFLFLNITRDEGTGGSVF